MDNNSLFWISSITKHLQLNISSFIYCSMDDSLRAHIHMRIADPTVLLPRDRSQTWWKTRSNRSTDSRSARRDHRLFPLRQVSRVPSKELPRAIMIMATVAESPNPC